MSEIAAFILAQYDRVERAAKAATSGPWHVGDVVEELGIADVYGSDGRVTSAFQQPCCSVEDAEHIAINDPEYVLADIASKRRIVELHGDQHECTDTRASEYPYVGCETLRLLAALFSAEPGYDKRWTV
jgi:hypothetical protein